MLISYDTRRSGIFNKYTDRINFIYCFKNIDIEFDFDIYIDNYTIDFYVVRNIDYTTDIVISVLRL